MTERSMTRMGWTITALFALFMLGASIAPKLLGMPVAGETLVALGWPARFALPIGLLELACLMLYLYPPTRYLGAIVTTGLLGGAMATQVRIGNPLFSHILFSLYLGLFLWGGLWLRDRALRARAVRPWPRSPGVDGAAAQTKRMPCAIE